MTVLIHPLNRGLVEARVEYDSLVQAKAKAKIKNEAKRQELERALDEKAKTSPSPLIRTAEYVKWDEDGLPLVDAQGQEITKSRRKKPVKE